MDLSLLNNDISHEILSQLPANILVSTRFVSKGWQRLIQDPDFVRHHIIRAPPSTLSGYFFQPRFTHNAFDIEKISYIPIGRDQPEIHQDVLSFLPDKVSIWGSSNGLICCRSLIPCDKPFIYICNPVIKGWIRVRWDRGLLSNDEYLGFGFEPCVSTLDGCKLVRVSEVKNHDKYFGFKVYDWKRETWVESKEICYCEDSLIHNKSVMIKGVLYWPTNDHQILSFDVDNEVSLLINPPDIDNLIKYETCVGEADGRLHFIIVTKSGLQVWVLVDRFGPIWDLKNFIPLELMEQENPESLANLVEQVGDYSATPAFEPWMRPWALRDSFVFLNVGDSVYSFHVDTRELKWLAFVKHLGPHSYHCPMVLPYSMTLASFGGN